MVRTYSGRDTPGKSLLVSETYLFDNVRRLLRLPQTAGDLMTPDPVSLNEDMTVSQAAAFLVRRRISAAPVINQAGRPVGVVSQSDIVRQAADDLGILHRNTPSALDGEESFLDEVLDRSELAVCTGQLNELTVREIMTPRVYTVTPETPVVDVVRELLGHDVHRLFVTDDDGVLIGVITALDVLRSLRR